MIKFRQKEYTIQEGHYTGPKEMEDIPGYLEMAGKGSLAGAGIGAVAGAIIKDQHGKNDILGGTIKGAEYGALGGIVAKFFLNYLHKPMSTVKYQEVDKAIRRSFGVYQVSGFTVGDSVGKRANINEKFEFNNRSVTDFKLNFAIHNNTVTMYTFGMDKSELEKVNSILDAYCKKYFSMEYSAKAINAKVNSYAVDITFTNYYAISQFIMELSDALGTKINLLDNNAIVERRLSGEEEQKEFSFGVNLYKSLVEAISRGKRNPAEGIAFGAVKLADEMIREAGEQELIKMGVPSASKNFNNDYLLDTLKKLHYVERFNYTVKEKSADVQMSLIKGVLTITTTGNELDSLKMFKKSKALRVNIYTYPMKDRNEFEFVVKRVMSLGLKPNVYDPN